MVSFTPSPSAKLALDSLDANLRELADSSSGRGWSNSQRRIFIKLLAMAYSPGNSRAPYLWTTQGKIRRKFCNFQLDDYDFLGRLIAVLALYTPWDEQRYLGRYYDVPCPIPPDEYGPSKFKDLTHSDLLFHNFRHYEYTSYRWYTDYQNSSSEETFYYTWIYGTSNLPGWLPDYLRVDGSSNTGDDWEQWREWVEH